LTVALFVTDLAYGSVPGIGVDLHEAIRRIPYGYLATLIQRMRPRAKSVGCRFVPPPTCTR
jgi:hypothetical protein